MEWNGGDKDKKCGSLNYFVGTIDIHINMDNAPEKN